MAKLNEQNIITLFKQTGSPDQLNDDAAVIYHDDTMLTTSQDTLNERTHFMLDYCPPEAIAHKCLTANLSDMAAMGLTGHYLLQSLSIPASISNDWVEAYAKGLNQRCEMADIKLIGGDTTRLQDHVSITMTILDIRAQKRVLTREGIHCGDTIFISNPIGAACAGLHALEQNQSVHAFYINAFLYPNPQTMLGQWLSTTHAVSACMDLTDGLAQDLNRLCVLNDLSATIDIEKIPHRNDWEPTCQTLNLDPIQTMLTGGEDFALLVAGKAELAEISGGKLHPIGHFHSTVTPASITWLLKGKPVPLNDTGFKHF